MNDLIMIVEDDPYISHFLQMSFEQEGYRILMTTKGHEALSLFYSHQPDIVILDLGLPDIDGLEVIQEIRKISSKPIIVVSARLEEQEKIEKSYTKEDAIQIGTTKLEKIIEDEIGTNKNIIDKKVDVIEIDNYIEVNVTYEIIENIGIQEKIE